MAIQFPANPALDEIFTDPTSGESWRWDGTKWNGLGEEAIWERNGNLITPTNAGDDIETTGTIDGANVPTVPGDGTITVTQGGTEVGSFSVNQTGNATIPLAQAVTPGDGTITVNEGATQIAQFSVDQANDATVNLTEVGDGTITFNQGGTQIGQFSVNQTGNTTVNIGGGGAGEVVAWARQNANGSLAAGGNISSAQRTNTGRYRLNFGTAVNSNAATSVTPQDTRAQTGTVFSSNTTSVDFGTADVGDNGGVFNDNLVHVIVTD